MTAGPATIDDWREFVIWAVLAGVMVINVLIGLRAHRTTVANGQHAANAAEDARAIRAQVENSHASNLRDDLDLIAAAQDRHSRSIQDLHVKVDRVDDKASRIGDEVRTEKNLRREADARTNAKVDTTIELVAKHHPGSE